MTATCLAVLISDVHYALGTLELADSSMHQAIDKAKEFGIPLIVGGDLNDTKDILRGKCANAMIKTLEYARDLGVQVYILIGNHDLLHEKADAHSLNFLRPYATIIDQPTDLQLKNRQVVHAIPYQNSTERLEIILSEKREGDWIIMHQGVMGAYMGEYAVDKTSLPKETFANFRVISGHYHRAQDIKCGRPRKGAVGLFSYIGSPYTTTFAEANDGPKGYRVLCSDGTLSSFPTNLRKHVIIERDVEDIMNSIPGVSPGDVVWLKVSGPSVELDKLSKKTIGLHHFGHQNYKLDRLSTDVESRLDEIEKMTPEEMIDSLIEQNEPCLKQDAYLKQLWRELLS